MRPSPAAVRRFEAGAVVLPPVDGGAGPPQRGDRLARDARLPRGATRAPLFVGDGASMLSTTLAGAPAVAMAWVARATPPSEAEAMARRVPGV